MMQLQTVRRQAVQSPIESYLRDIDDTSLLTAAEEKELAYRIEEGDAVARDQLIRANLRLVVKIARGYQGKGLGFQDLIAEGNLGLMRAVEAFDPRRNTRFSTYATYWIRQTIKRALMSSARPIRIPGYMIQLLVTWRQTATRLQEKWQRTPTHEEVAQALRIPKRKINSICKAFRVFEALQRNDQGETGWSIAETVLDARCRPPEEALVENEDLQHVLELVARMDPREAAVLRLRFGLTGGEPLTLQAIGACLGLTRERVRQLERIALRKLGRRLNPTGLR